MRAIRSGSLGGALALMMLGAGTAAAQDRIEDIVRRIAAEKKAVAIVDDNLLGKSVGTGTQGLPPEAVRTILANAQVELIDEQTPSGPLLRAYHVKDLTTKIGAPRMLAEGEAIPGDNSYVSVTFRVRHADANGLQTAIRAEMTRDPRRLGNVIFVAATNSITVTDLAPSVMRFAKLVSELDRPPAREERLRNTRFDLEVWAAPPDLLDRLRDKPAEAHALAAGDAKARRVAASSSAVAERAAPASGDKGPGGIATIVSDPGNPSDPTDDLEISFEAIPDMSSGRVAVRFSLRARIGKSALDLPPRLLNLRAGEWTLVHAGDPGLVAFVRAREE